MLAGETVNKKSTQGLYGQMVAQEEKININSQMQYMILANGLVRNRMMALMVSRNKEKRQENQKMKKGLKKKGINAQRCAESGATCLDTSKTASCTQILEGNVWKQDVHEKPSIKCPYNSPYGHIVTQKDGKHEEKKGGREFQEVGILLRDRSWQYVLTGAHLGQVCLCAFVKVGAGCIRIQNGCSLQSKRSNLKNEQLCASFRCIQSKWEGEQEWDSMSLQIWFEKSRNRMEQNER